MCKVTISHEFDYYKDQEEIKILMRAVDMHSLLVEIDNKLRNMIKFGNDDWFNDGCEDFLIDIRNMINEVMHDG